MTYCLVRSFAGRVEDLDGRADLDELADTVLVQQEHRRVVRHTGGLEHVVGDKDDGDLSGEASDEVLDLGGGDRIERRAGLVHQQDVGLDRKGAGDAQPLLLTSRKAQGALMEPILDDVP